MFPELNHYFGVPPLMETPTWYSNDIYGVPPLDSYHPQYMKGSIIPELLTNQQLEVPKMGVPHTDGLVQGKSQSEIDDDWG